MVYVTGDTHGDFSRFSKFKKMFCKYKDYIFVCGDFGFVWDGSERERKTLAKFRNLDCVVLFVEGTHDNIDLLNGYPQVEFCGGKARQLEKNLFWLERGGIYLIEDKKFFTMGGGESDDADDRIQGESWWKEEIPSIAELNQGSENLKKHDYEVDYIITHLSPAVELGMIDGRNDRVISFLAFMEQTRKSTTFKHWYFGSKHLDKGISSKMTAVFEKVLTVK